LSYVLTANELTEKTVVGVAVAFMLAGFSSSCITYVFAERAARPLSVVALQDAPAQHVMHGVQTRMIAVWAVSSAVPMLGLLIINIGRWT
ncbi:adenylate/guanylate cyclase domain-containing protein, partial [Streptomyces sp. SID10244]|nr:adenylate/guanylate cyclase domain-containing protein [Streptomyces sp. SID10244]